MWMVIIILSEQKSGHILVNVLFQLIYQTFIGLYVKLYEWIKYYVRLCGEN